jgi:inhibitor of cysteine peptidase
LIEIPGVSVYRARNFRKEESKIKKLSIILSLLLVVSLVIVAFGCAAEEPAEVVPEGPPIPPPREEVSVDASYDGKEVEITTRNALIVTLESNATTGFKWELTKLTSQPEEPAPREEAEEPGSEPEEPGPEPTKPVVVVPEELPEKTVLKHVDNKYIPPEAKGVEGAAGKEVWTFHAEEKGKSTICMEYRRPWEQGVEPAKTFTLTVVVK